MANDEDRWIVARMREEVLSRLVAVRRSFEHALIIGDPVLAVELGTRGILVTNCDAGHPAANVRCDEDRLPFADGSFDLILSPGVLDSVNDVPGALILIRRLLRPGGLFLGAMAGAGSLATLRRCLPAGIARFHPQIDVRSAGDLLGRAGFSLPVADSDVVAVRYASADTLAKDLRANGLRNCLAKRWPLGREDWRQALERFQTLSVDGRTDETITLIYLTGWAPEAVLAKS